VVFFLFLQNLHFFLATFSLVVIDDLLFYMLLDNLFPFFNNNF